MLPLDVSLNIISSRKTPRARLCSMSSQHPALLFYNTYHNWSHFFNKIDFCLLSVSPNILYAPWGQGPILSCSLATESPGSSTQEVLQFIIVWTYFKKMNERGHLYWSLQRSLWRILSEHKVFLLLKDRYRVCFLYSNPREPERWRAPTL